MPYSLPMLQISAAELSSAMTFLREQMGEEELRHLLEMLSVEAGASLSGNGSSSGGRWGWHRRSALQRRALLGCSSHLPSAGVHVIAACTLHLHCPLAGKDGGIDVNRLMELADEAEEEEENGKHSEQQ